MNGNRSVISIDIGSTFTKGALFSIGKKEAKLLNQAAFPTTTENLPEAAFKVLRSLLSLNDSDPIPDKNGLPEVFFSSSAKGGLRISVLGLVPELSLQIGRLVAWSAGARVISAISYGLTKDSVEQIERENPDILLFCGGTDGGHEKTGIRNANRLASSNFSGTIIYAGNNQIQDEISEILENKKLIIVPNVMPDIGKFEGEAAREAIQKEFLQTIVKGKGLEELVSYFGTKPSPTPRAMLELVKTVAKKNREWSELVVVDTGGATTDVYSYSEPLKGGDSVILRGITEPVAKRSVEGDLGMRISAQSLYFILKEEFEKSESLGEPFLNDLETWVSTICKNASVLPQSPCESKLDEIMATGCLRHAVIRHAGRMEKSWTPGGKVWLQRGKDLRAVPKIVLTGGYSAKNCGKDLYDLAISSDSLNQGETMILAPENPHCFVDRPYLWPLLGNIATQFPEAAAELAVSNLFAPLKAAGQDENSLSKESLQRECH